MPENENNANPPTNDNNPPTNPPSNDGGDKTDWKAEAEKWKSLSRKHEDAEKNLRKEVDDLRNASMSDAEKALENARKEGEKAGITRGTERVVRAELRAAAAEKGVTLPDLEHLNLAKFANEDGEPNAEAIEKFVSSLGGSKSQFANGADLGIGRTGGGVKQWTRADLNGKTHREIVEAREKGHLDNLLGRN